MSLLTITEQQAVKPISQNNTKIFNQIQKETEEYELKKLLGVALLQDIQKNPAIERNATLLNGGTFEDCNGNQIDFKGIKYILAYMNYSRYIGISGIKDTYTGFVNKNRQEADSISEGSMASLKRENRQIAMEEWLLVKEYLNEKYTLYPLWNSSKTKKPYSPKFTPLRKTLK